MNIITFFFLGKGVLYLIQLLLGNVSVSVWWRAFLSDYLLYLLFYFWWNLKWKEKRNIVKKRKFIRGFLFLVLLLALFNSLLVLWEYPYISTNDINYRNFLDRLGFLDNISFAWHTQRATGLWENCNAYGSHLLAAYLVLFYLIFFYIEEFRLKKEIKILLYLFYFVSLYFFNQNLLFTISRSTMVIAIPVALTFLGIIFTFYLKEKRWILLLSFLLISWQFYDFFTHPNQITKRIEIKCKILQDNIAQKKDVTREWIFRTATRYLTEKRSHFWWGLGPGKVYPFYLKKTGREDFKSAHNIYLQYWLEFGLLGEVFWLIFLFIFFWQNIIFFKRTFFYLIGEERKKISLARRELIFFSFISFTWILAELMKLCWGYYFTSPFYGFLFFLFLFINLYSREELKSYLK